MIDSLSKKFGEYLIVGVLFTGLYYSVTTSYKNDERLSVVGSDIKSIKKSMISILLDEKPDKSDIAKELISDSGFIKGVEKYKAGNYENAYAIWEDAAEKGNRDSVYAIVVANESLKDKLNISSISKTERENIETVLKNAPVVIEKHGIYYFEPKK